MDAQTTVYVLFGLVFILCMVFVVTGKWVKFALQARFYKKRWGEGNVGLVLVRGMGNNIGIPSFVQLDNNVKQTKDETNIYQREQFVDGTMFGLPYIIVDSQDTKTSIGLYHRLRALIRQEALPTERYSFFKEVTDKDGKKSYIDLTYKQFHLYKAQCDMYGEPMYHQVATNQKDPETNKTIVLQTKIPILDAIKSSVTLDPGLVRKAVVNMALSEAINEFLKKHKILLIGIGAAVLLALVAAFFAYNNQNAISTLCVNNLPQIKSDIIGACTTALKNATLVVK